MTPSVIARVRFVARAAMLVGVLIVGGSAVLPAYADNQQFNGSWVLDPTASEDFAVALKKFNEMIKAQKHKHAKHFMNEQKTKGANQFYSHETETMTAIEEDSRIMIWDVSDDLRTLLAAKTLKLYQANLCALLYDKKIKRLVSVNLDGKSYSLSGNQSSRDALGRSTGYFDQGALVIDTDVDGGDRLVERFTLDTDASHLTITVKLRRTDVGRTLEYKRVYARGE